MNQATTSPCICHLELRGMGLEEETVSALKLQARRANLKWVPFSWGQTFQEIPIGEGGLRSMQRAGQSRGGQE